MIDICLCLLIATEDPQNDETHHASYFFALFMDVNHLAFVTCVPDVNEKLKWRSGTCPT